MPSSSFRHRRPFVHAGRRPACVLLWLLACGLPSAPVYAQVAPIRQSLEDEVVDEGDTPEVEALVANAITLRADGKDREALATLQQAAQLDPRSLRVQVHLSNVYQALGEWLLADQFLRQALSTPQHPYVQRHRQALAEARSVIDDHLGKLEVAGEPQGAEVLLNGRNIGTLPLSDAVPVMVGSYTLEVRMPGHYTVSRPLTIAARDHVRESVRLEPRPIEESRSVASPMTPAPELALERPSRRPWLTWTLGGLSVAAAATTVGAVIYREAHAQRWNDNARCLSTERTRAQLCGSERDKVQTGDAWALGAGVATGVFAAGALLNAYVFLEAPGERAGLGGCGLGVRGLGLQGVSCFGAF